MKLREAFRCCGVAILLIANCNVPDLRAQTLDVAERPLDADKVLPLYPGRAPGSESWTWHEQVGDPPSGGRGGRLVRNVVQPTLTVFFPPNPTRKNGAAVIIAPGGGNIWLSIDSEGYNVARALAAQGVTAIVLKYRLNHTPEDPAAFKDQALALLARMRARAPGAAASPPPQPPRVGPVPDPRSSPAIADGLAAVRYVHEHAADLGVDPRRVGIVGFSAGGGVTVGTLRFGEGASRPDFAGVIYAGAPADVVWPQNLPPIFMAVSADDPVAGTNSLTMFNTLRAQGHLAELHVFAKGGHGFGLQKRGLTTDLWLDEFVAWMASGGLLLAGAAP
jgi:acetyl esterase/lipase